jgi:hypothetical protein
MALRNKYCYDIILYLKFKVPNHKAKFVPREHEIYYRMAPYIIVFDVKNITWRFDHVTQVTGGI